MTLKLYKFFLITEKYLSKNQNKWIKVLQRPQLKVQLIPKKLSSSFSDSTDG